MNNNHQDALVHSADSLAGFIDTKEPSRPIIQFFNAPFFVFLLLDWITWGFFRRYWLYDNWKAIKRAEKSDISPFWRAVFGIFFAGELFEYIAEAAKEQGYKKTVHHRLCVNSYIVLVLLSKGAVVVFSLVTATIPENGAQGAIFLFSLIWITLIDLAFWPIQKAINFYDAKREQNRQAIASQEPAPIVPYFQVSPVRFLILNILTARMYTAYWFYKNWQAVKKATYRNVRPFWRGVFFYFFAHTLFKNVQDTATRKGYPVKSSYQRLATWYVVVLLILIIFNSLIRRYWDTYLWTSLVIIGIGAVLDTMFLWPIQKTIQWYNTQANPNYQSPKGFTRGEIILLVIGVLVYGLLFSGKLDKLAATAGGIRSAQRATTWTIFQPKSKDFEVKFPATPTHEAQQLPIEETDLSIDYTSYTVDQDGVYYSVTRMVYPPAIDLSNLEAEDLIQDIVETSAENKLIDSQKTKVGEHRAADFLIKSSYVHLKGRIVLVGQTKYLLMISYFKTHPASDYEKFIKSFSVKATS